MDLIVIYCDRALPDPTLPEAATGGTERKPPSSRHDKSDRENKKDYGATEGDAVPRQSGGVRVLGGRREEEWRWSGLPQKCTAAPAAAAAAAAAAMFKDACLGP